MKIRQPKKYPTWSRKQSFINFLRHMKEKEQEYFTPAEVNGYFDKNYPSLVTKVGTISKYLYSHQKEFGIRMMQRARNGHQVSKWEFRMEEVKQ